MNTVRDQLTICGVNNVNNWHGQTQAQRIASDLFNDDHESARDMKFSDLTEDFKSYSALTVANGQICLSPGTKRNIRAFIQWCKHVFCLGGNPALTPFPVGTTPTLLRQEQSHLKFVKKSKTIVKSGKPTRFTTEMK